MRAQEQMEEVDPVPVEGLVDYRPSAPTIEEQVRQLAQQYMAQAAEKFGIPTYEEEDDFDEDDPEPYLSDAQLQEMEADWLMEARANGEFAEDEPAEPAPAEPPQIKGEKLTSPDSLTTEDLQSPEQ